MFGLGWNNSIGLPEGSSTRTCLPPLPSTIGLRKRTPAVFRLSTIDHDIGDLDLNPVPSAWCGALSVRHGLSGATGARPVQQQAKCAAGQRGKARRGCMSTSLKPNIPA